MRKISTLAFMAFFCCMSAMAQVVLGDIKFSIKDGAKLSPTTGKITVTFPDVTGVADPTAAKLVIAGNFGEDNGFDGLEGTLASGVTIDFADDYGLEASKEYTLTITSVKVDGAELAAEGGYKLIFKTRGAERKMSWTFAIDDASLAQIAAEATDNAEAQDVAKYIDITKNGAVRYYVPARDNEEIVLPDGTTLPATEDLTFKFGEKVFYVSGHSGSWADAICFNGKNQYMTIPDCKEGDVITFNANRATKADQAKGKYTSIVVMNGAASAPEGFAWLDPESEIKDSVMLGSNYTSFKFEVLTAGDVTFKFCNCLVKTITIEEGVEKKPCKYKVVAGYTEDEKTTILKELVAETEGITSSTVKAYYPYWLADEQGNVYTYGTKGNPFEASFDLKGDTTFVINYKKTAFEGCVFLSEGEDLPNAALCTSGNAAIRSSMGKAAYLAEDLKLVTLQPGTYKVRAITADYTSKSGGYDCVLTKGEGEENEIHLVATADNWNDIESDLLTITEATDITLKASGNENQGIDVIMIYASTDAPEDPDGISEVKDAKKVVARKVAKDGRILIQTAAGTFNAVGVQVK